MPTLSQAAIAANNAGALATDQDVVGFTTLTVIGQIGSNTGAAATAAGDANAFVLAYPDDETSPAVSAPLTADHADTILSGNVAYSIKRYTLYGLSRVQVRLQNSNATAALDGRLDWFVA